MPGNIMESILQVGGAEETSFLEILFTKDYRKLKMVSEMPPDQVFPFTVLGLIQKRFKSKVLKTFDEEFLLRQKSKDRKGIVELVEVMLSQRRPMDEE